MSELSGVEGIVLDTIQSRFGTRIDKLDHQTPIFENGLCLDSIEFLELLLDIERSCRVQLREETFTEDAVIDVGGLIKYIQHVV